MWLQQQYLNIDNTSLMDITFNSTLLFALSLFFALCIKKILPDMAFHFQQHIFSLHEDVGHNKYPDNGFSIWILAPNWVLEYPCKSLVILSFFFQTSLFGEGTYLTSDLSMAFLYSPHGNGWCDSVLGPVLSCIALCEIIDHPDVKCQVKKKGNVPQIKNNVPSVIQLFRNVIYHVNDLTFVFLMQNSFLYYTLACECYL